MLHIMGCKGWCGVEFIIYLVAGTCPISFDTGQLGLACLLPFLASSPSFLLFLLVLCVGHFGVVGLLRHLVDKLC